MFSLSDFKAYGSISESDTDKDALIVKTLLPTAQSLLAQILARPATTPVKAQGTIRFNRKQGNTEPVTITPSYNFILNGLRYKIKSETNILITADKTEQDLSCVALNTGSEFNHLSGETMQVIPSVSQGVFLSLGFFGGKADFELPDTPPIIQATYYITLYMFENRNFLKKDLRDAVTKEVLSLVSKSRDNLKFMPGVDSA